MNILAYSELKTFQKTYMLYRSANPMIENAVEWRNNEKTIMLRQMFNTERWTATFLSCPWLKNFSFIAVGISVLTMWQYLQCNIIGGLVDFVRSLVGATLDDDSSQTH